MGIFSSNKISQVDWTPIESVEQLETLIANNASGPLLFFKHSTRCPISSFALRRFESDWKKEAVFASTYFIDLLAHRDVSDALSRITGVVHQSPQALVLSKGSVIYHASHEQIDANQIMDLLAKNL